MLGYSSSGIDRALTAGRLHRLHRGVFPVGHTNLSWHGQCLAAVLACGDGALLSHYSAAWLLGIWQGSPVPIHVATPIPRSLHLPVRRHHSRILEPKDRAMVEEIPVTALARTLLDLAAHARFDRLTRMVERSEELRILDVGPIESLLARSGGHRGAHGLRRAIALHLPVAVSRSGFELDVYWPDRRFAIELDTFATHGTHEAFERDRLRQEDLLLVGIELTRVTDARLAREPERVTRLLGQRPVWA